MCANIEGSYPEIERVETGLRSMDLALSGSGNVAGVPMTIYEVFGFQGVGKTTFSTSLAGIIAEYYKKNIVYAPIEHVDRVLMNDQLDSVGFKSGLVSILGGWDMAKKFLDLKKGKEDIITDEIILDCMREALRRDEYCVGILDSLTAISPFEEGEGSTADKNMGRRARLVGALVRGILYDSRFRTSPYMTILLSHKTNPMSLTPTNTGVPTTGGETKKNIAKVRISLRRIVEKSMNDLGENAYILEGKVDKNNFGADKGMFVVAIVGGKGIHRGLTAMYECKRAKICTFGKSITLAGQSYGSMRDIVAKAHDREEDKFFQPFIDAIRTPSKFEKVKEEEEDDDALRPWETELPE